MTTDKLKVLGLIPARGGSKGVPGKNTMTLDGKPLIQYAVDCALASKQVDKILINSDDTRILEAVHVKEDSSRIIKQERPKELGKDHSSIVDVVVDALGKLEEQFDLIILMQTTSPLRSSKDIDRIIDHFKYDDHLEGMISVIPMEDMHPARMYKLDDEQYLSPLISSNESSHRQDLQPVYFRNGCFYAIRVNAFLEQRSFMPKHKKAYIMNPDHLLNIDAPRDVKLAEVLIDAWKKNEL